MRLTFLETRHSGLQFEHKDKTIPIRIKENMIFFFNLALRATTVVTGKPNFTCSSLPPISKFNVIDFPKS